MTFINGQYMFGFNHDFSDFLWDLNDYYEWASWTPGEHRDAIKSSLSY